MARKTHISYQLIAIFWGDFMQQKTQQQTQVKQETKPTSLPITSNELEQTLADAGATIQHPVKHDPVAVKDGKTIAIWVS
jgi:hypothetical protein